MSNATLTVARQPARQINSLTFHLLSARVAKKDGAGLLHLLSILAFATVTAISTIVASGTWMFYQRASHPFGVIELVLQSDPTFKQVLDFYVFLAFFACIILLFPLLSLTAAATVLGAHMRERRLATFRLLGLTRGEVNRMGAIETLSQAIVGVVLGTAVGLLLLPFFKRFSFMSIGIQLKELIMPWWSYVLLDIGILGIVALATWLGLQKVNISPLGVARRSMPQALRWWRLIVLVIATGFLILKPAPKPTDGALEQWAVTIAAFAIFLLAIDIALPFIFQIAARVIARCPVPAVSWASRRVAFEPKKAWRRASGIVILVLLVSFVSSTPISMSSSDDVVVDTVAKAVVKDVSLGFTLTMLFTYVLAGVSAMINQSSAELERAEETLAMQKIGVPSNLSLIASWIEVVGPLLGVSIIAWGLGRIMAIPVKVYEQYSTGTDQRFFDDPLTLLLLIAAGTAIVVLGLMATLPLRNKVLAQTRQRRTQD